MSALLAATWLAVALAAFAAPTAWAEEPSSTAPRRAIPLPAPRQALPAASQESTEPSTGEQSFGGAIGVRAMFWMDRTDNLVEQMDWYREPYPLSLARLDLYRNFSTLTSLDLKLRSPSDQDWGAGMALRSLPYFTTQHNFTDSTFYNLPIPLETGRQRYWGDLKLRKFGQVPVKLAYDVHALQGIGFDKDRSYYDEQYSLDAHAHMRGFDLDVSVPRLDYHDRHDRSNDTETRGFALSATRTLLDGDADLQASFRRTLAYLESVAQESQVDTWELRGLMYEIFGVEGFKLDTRATYRDTPQDLGLTARTDSLLNAKAVLSLTQGSGYSVQVGREHRKVRRERLTRAGFDRVGMVATATRDDLAPFRLTDEPRYDDLFGRAFFRFKPWFSATFFQKETSMEDQPPTDLVRFHSPALLFDRQRDRRLDLQLQPLTNIGVNFRLHEQRNKNLARIYREVVRNKQTDFYWLLVNSRLNIGGSIAYLEISPSTDEVFAARENATTRGGSISYQLSPELSVFGDYTVIDSEGFRFSTERITNIGLEAETGTRHRLTWRCAFTVDEQLSQPRNLEDFDVRGINISGEAQF
ncbi:MAG: hypothetical protein HY816_10175 [Candidatus Wallbacteria bacterium]|nr:hypothetical protein [Candidatus Wallbacteria bacterium]